MIKPGNQLTDTLLFVRRGMVVNFSALNVSVYVSFRREGGRVRKGVTKGWQRGSCRKRRGGDLT